MQISVVVLAVSSSACGLTRSAYPALRVAGGAGACPSCFLGWMQCTPWTVLSPGKMSELYI